MRRNNKRNFKNAHFQGLTPFTHLSTSNGRMVGNGTKPFQITPDGTCIRLEALRIRNSPTATPVLFSTLYSKPLTTHHISSNGCITLSTYDSQNKTVILQISPNNDADGDGLSDDWETSEIQYLIAGDPTQWGYLAAAGTLDATTTYWQDGYTALQSFVLGLSSDWRELSKTTDLDLDGVPDIEDADPLDWVVDWKPAGEASYAVIELDQLNYQGMPTWNEFDPYKGFSASIGDTGTILWKDKIRAVDSEGRESWSERCRIWKSGTWTTDIREAPTIFASIPLIGQYRADQTSARIPLNGPASPLSPPPAADTGMPGRATA
jgi:hypothetical protein